MLFGKFLMGSHGILANSNHHGIDAFELLIGACKGAGLPGAAGSVVPGVEVEHHLFTRKIRQGYHVSVLIGQGELRGFCSDFQHFNVLL